MAGDRPLEAEIALALAQLRERKGISQEALASQLGRSQSYVAKVETGKLRVTLAAFLQWIGALGIRDSEVHDLVNSLRALATSESLWREGQGSDD